MPIEKRHTSAPEELVIVSGRYDNENIRVYGIRFIRIDALGTIGIAYGKDGHTGFDGEPGYRKFDIGLDEALEMIESLEEMVKHLADIATEGRAYNPIGEYKRKRREEIAKNTQ